MSLENILRKLRMDVTALQRRLAVIPTSLPPRLSSRGQQVTDWDLAILPGFYWSYTGSTLNSPRAAWWSGIVQWMGDVQPNGDDNRRIIQTLTIGDPGRWGYEQWNRTGAFSGTTTTWSPWVRVDGRDGPWTTLPLQPGVVRWDTLRTPQYKVLASGDVMLSGLVKPETGTFTGKVHLSNIPVPLAPNTQSVMGLTGVSAFGRLNAAATGHLETDFGTSAFTYVFLDNILLRGA